MIKKITNFSLLLSLFVPFFAQAQGVQQLISRFDNLLSGVPVVIFGIALVFFLWGLAKFILVAGDEKKIQEGKNLMIWGIVAIFVMVSIWGIIRALQVIFGFNSVTF